MRRKIKELMNKEEGFTLVELLAVIVILGIIVAIAIPAVGSVIDKADGGATEAEAALVEDAARLYVTTEDDVTVPEGETGLEIGTETLKTAGFLENRSDGDVSGSVTIKKDTNGNYTYKFDSDGDTDAGKKTDI